MGQHSKAQLHLPFAIVAITCKNTEYFSEDQSGDAEYERKIISLLTEKQLSMTELAHEMGYKGITAKLKRTTEALLQKKNCRW